MRSFILFAAFILSSFSVLPAQQAPFHAKGQPLDGIRSAYVSVLLCHDTLGRVLASYRPFYAALFTGEEEVRETGSRYRDIRPLYLTDAQGKPLIFRNMTHAINLMAAQGWELAHTTNFQTGGGEEPVMNFPVLIFRRPAASLPKSNIR